MAGPDRDHPRINAAAAETAGLYMTDLPSLAIVVVVVEMRNIAIAPKPSTAAR
jgi:hypothetical protein